MAMAGSALAARATLFLYSGLGSNCTSALYLYINGVEGIALTHQDGLSDVHYEEAQFRHYLTMLNTTVTAATWDSNDYYQIAIR